MCAGAIVNARIEKIFFAARDPKGGAFGSNLDITEVKGINHYPEYEFVEDGEYIRLLKEFFKGKRK